MKSIYRNYAYVFLMAICFAIITPALGQKNWGVGLRLGDPSGITIKKYSGNHAFELSVGRSHLWYGRGWYDKRFNGWYEKQKFGYKDFHYIGYWSSVPIGIQVHYLVQKGLKNAEGLDWYYGIGGQLRYQTFRYDYRYKLDGNPDWFYDKGSRVTDIDVGIDGVIGLEYKFRNAPFSMFADATLFMEVVDSPFAFWLQGGVGVRYNF